MGYTHYWNVREEGEKSFAFLLADTKTIIDAERSHVVLVNGMGDEGTSPELSEGRIVFNGEDPDGYETFYFAKDGRGFQFCKTGRKPYDAIVCAVLIRAKVHYGDGIEISSDGDWENTEEWGQGALLCRELFGEAVDPLRGRPAA